MRSCALPASGSSAPQPVSSVSRPSLSTHRSSKRLLRFAAAQGATRLDDVTADLVAYFIQAPGHDRRQRIILNPAAGTRRQRRSALEALFSEARALGLTTAAPLVDLPPIPRSPRKRGTELSDADVQLLRFHSERGMPDTRHAALLALLLAGLHSAEIAAATTDELNLLDLFQAAVWTDGATRTRGRSCPLDEWSARALWLRHAYLLRSAGTGSPQRLVTAASSAYRSQASVCSGFGDIARRSGLTTQERRVEPKDVTRYVARKILDETDSSPRSPAAWGCPPSTQPPLWPTSSGSPRTTAKAARQREPSQETQPAQGKDHQRPELALGPHPRRRLRCCL